MGRIELSNPQSAAYWSRAKSTAVVAGFGSGKTYTAVIKAFKLLRDFPGVPVGYAAPTYGLIKDIWYPALEEYAETHNYRIHVSRGDHVVTVAGLGKIVCRSLSNPGKIVGFEVGDFLLDEMDILKTDIALEGWRKCKARCRYKFPAKKMKLPGGGKTKKIRKKNQMAAFTTPEGYRATYQMFKQEPLKKSLLIQMSTYSNIHNLPDDYIDELKANYPPQLIQAYINGEFTNLTSGRVWTSYDRTLNRTRETIRKGDHLILGMDFNVGRGCVVAYVRRPQGFCAVGELVNTIDTPGSIRAVQERWGDHGITVIPDATGKNRKSINATTSDIKLLQLAGFHVVRNESNPNIKDRVTATNAMLCNGMDQRRLLVNDFEAPHFAEALEQQAYDDNGMPEKGVGKFDDITDAGTYPIAKLFPIKGGRAKIRRVAI
jgi:hypothetical protein